MKILHCADIHLDSAMTANLDKDKARERRNELLASFKDMVGYAVKERIGVIIIACIKRKASIYLTRIITVKLHAGNNNILCNTTIINYTSIVTCPLFSKHTKISRNLIQI